MFYLTQQKGLCGCDQGRPPILGYASQPSRITRAITNGTRRQRSRPERKTEEGCQAPGNEVPREAGSGRQHYDQGAELYQQPNEQGHTSSGASRRDADRGPGWMLDLQNGNNTLVLFLAKCVICFSSHSRSVHTHPSVLQPDALNQNPPLPQAQGMGRMGSFRLYF